MRIPFVATTLITLFPLVIVAFQSPWSILDLRSTHCFYQKFKFNQKSQVHSSYLPHNHNLPKTTRRTDSYHVQQERTRCSIAPIHMSLDASGFGSSMTTLMSSLFRTSGGVPFIEAFGVNAVLFAALSQKLFTMLTPTGFAHSLVLGTSLWATLGWKGWLYCVVYLFLGQAVTKVRFTEKQEAGLAEGRGGRRGPENVWYVVKISKRIRISVQKSNSTCCGANLFILTISLLVFCLVVGVRRLRQCFVQCFLAKSETLFLELVAKRFCWGTWPPWLPSWQIRLLLKLVKRTAKPLFLLQH